MSKGGRRLQITSATSAARVSPGHPPAVARLFEQHAAYVARVALRVLGRDADVEDVVQDVFAVVLSKLPQLQQVQSVRQWLAGIAIKRARDLMRRRRVRRAFANDQAAHVPSGDAGELLTRLHRALDRLPSHERNAWELRYLEGESLEDVARRCNCSLGTARRRVRAGEVAAQEALDHRP